VISSSTTLRQRLLGHDAGALVFLLRLLLLPLSGLYWLGTTARNALYDAGLLAQARVGAPVVSVGNLTVGGTGKTPMVVLLANRAVREGRKVAVVARGYGAVADAHGNTDEVALIAARCPGARVVVGPDKTASARRAVEQGADFVIVDDGLQHRRLHRDAEVVMVDARAPFGNGSVLPGGPLREPPGGLARASVIVLTHGETLEAGQRQTVLTQVRAFRLPVPVVWAEHVATGVRPVTGGALAPAESLAGRDLFLFCGIASPEGFRQTVETLGGRVSGVLAFPDHHDFTATDMARVRAAARAACLLCTEKDALKVARIPGHEDVLCLVIDLALAERLPPLPGLDAPWAPPRAEPAHGHAAHAPAAGHENHGHAAGAGGHRDGGHH
jgi:tetraacyldisaccharide 4'-kinase